MKKMEFATKILLAVLFLMLSFSCRKSIVNEYSAVVPEDKSDGFVDVLLCAGNDSSSFDADEAGSLTKVTIKGLKRTWESGDAIGIFAGENVNVKFTLTSGAGSSRATFRGRMKEVVAPTTLYAYYPYSEEQTDPSQIMVDMTEQTYDGDYSENGTFPGYRKYSAMMGMVSRFTVTGQQGWPAGKTVSMMSLTGIVNFELKAEDGDVCLQNLQLMTPGTNSRLRNFYYMDIVGTTYSYFLTDVLSLNMSESEEDFVKIEKGQTKYAQMAVIPSNFNGSELRIIASGRTDDRNVRYSVSKFPRAASNFSFDVRRKITVPLNNPVFSSKVKIRQRGESITAPIFDQNSSSYGNGDVFWGDGSVETYHAGLFHRFPDNSQHIVNVNAWNSSAIAFESLDNILAVDFTEL